MQHAFKIYNGENLLMDHLTAEKLNNGVTPSAHQHSSGTLITSFVGPCVSMGIAAPVVQGLFILYSAISHTWRIRWADHPSNESHLDSHFLAQVSI